MRHFHEWYKKSLAEISSEASLRIFGICLSLVHLATFVFWERHFFSRSTFNSGKGLAGPVCWSFFPACRDISLSVTTTSLIGGLYLALALFAIYSFGSKKITWAWWSLLALTLLKIGLMLLDYRTMGNYHYMPALSSLVFLFVPGRLAMLQILGMSFYLAAGLLKFNNEWLSGAALTGDPGIYGITLEWMCAYVVLLETCFVFGLLARRNWLRWLTLGQFIVFHLFSYLVVGWFYPVIAGLLLTIFPLAWMRSRPLVVTPLHAVLFALFFAAQAIPQLQSGDPALIGRGRLYSLNMLDASSQCFAQFFVKFEGSQYEIKPNVDQGFAMRLHCDPLVYWNYGKTLCESNAHTPNFRDIDFLLSSKRNTDESYSQIAAVTDFCKKATSFNTLLPNRWNEIE